ncbi:MAG: shikimate kinase [Oscillospiraceae bacterium]|nr:shikimate kinase [Oscillospiraceae bacterium]
MDNIILIGMPSSGKSTVGVILAKILGKGFTDTDLVIQAREKKLLSQLIEERGTEGFLEAEEQALLSITADDTVIATGGSAVYSKKGMESLSAGGTVVYLKVGWDELCRRLHDVRQRGVVLRNGETVRQMFESRSELYERYADIVVSEDGMSIEDTVRTVAERLGVQSLYTE